MGRPAVAAHGPLPGVVLLEGHHVESVEQPDDELPSCLGGQDRTWVTCPGFRAQDACRCTFGRAREVCWRLPHGGEPKTVANDKGPAFRRGPFASFSRVAAQPAGVFLPPVATKLTQSP